MAAYIPFLRHLPVGEIKAILDGRVPIPRGHTSPKEVLLQFITSHASVDILEELQNAALLRQQRKRASNAEQAERRQRARRSEGTSMADQVDVSKYMDLPSTEDVHRCYREFYNATSNEALQHGICAVCARERQVQEDGLSDMPISDLPSARLAPVHPHPAHTLTSGMLLEEGGVIYRDGVAVDARVCNDCASALSRSGDIPPALSLANDMWIGRIPWELERLTLPEQQLIALLYPRVYVVKLYPKDKDFRPPENSLQRAMRGNVSTYALDQAGVASMVEGRLMPRPINILSSIIAITFIGRGKLPKRCLRSSFRVRRDAVRRALLWLKANNPKYYGDIAIDEARLEALPEDDVPEEITALVRQSTDISVVDEESAGYVPDDAADELEGLELPPGVTLEDLQVESDEGDVIPFRVSGSIDADLSSVTAVELMRWGLENMWTDDHEGGYAVRHGTRPVRDFGPGASLRSGTVTDAESVEPDAENFFEKAFPCLFPYGCGGMEAVRRVSVDFRQHVRWALQYHDRRFRKHETFPFVTFGMIQRREGLHSAKVQMRRRDFETVATQLATLTVEKLKAAQREEEAGLPFSDPAVRALRQHVHAVAGRVVGNDAARFSYRSQIWSTSVILGPAAFWFTWNFTDHHDPIAQIFAGEQIDMDAFLRTAGPDGEQRARNIAADPFAAAKFFHFMVKTVLETLFKIKVSPFQVKTECGVIGDVAAYFGTVETQGRGTLHLHLLMWLQNMPSPDELVAMLQTEEFRAKVRAYIRANIRAYVPGLESATSIQAIPREKDIAYSRPPNPDSPTYAQDLDDFERRLARSEQVHTCKLKKCVFPNRHGRYVCKRKAPFETAREEFITEAGKWGPKRLFGLINGWCPHVLVNGRCNNDGKLLTSGRDTKNITFYVTSYTAKKQGRNYNMSAVLADGYAYHLEHPNAEYAQDLRRSQSLLLSRLVNTINREQEIAAPMVMSYLMGWGDVYRSHAYVPIYWSSFNRAIWKAFTALESNANDVAQPNAEGAPGPHGEVMERDNDDAEENVEQLTFDVGNGGRVYPQSQVTDYRFRGEDLEGTSVLDFFIGTYEEDISDRARRQRRRQGPAEEGQGEDDGNGNEGSTEDAAESTGRRAGRPSHMRVRYQDEHPNSTKKQRVKRGPTHRNLPNFVGMRFPNRNDVGSYAFYCASMLTLLKPWRNLYTDLRSASETWEAAFDRFLETASDRTRILRVLGGIQYFHDCQTAARDAEEDVPEDDHVDGEAGDEEGAAVFAGESEELSEAGLQQFIQANEISFRERIHAMNGLECARAARIFETSTPTEWAHGQGPPMPRASAETFDRLREWEAQLERDVQDLNQRTVVAGARDGRASEADGSGVERIDNRDGATANNGDDDPSVTLMPSEAALPAADPSELEDEQFCAYDIIKWHMAETLAERNPPTLRMILYGEGGTGKSRVIQTVTEEFAQRGVMFMLVKAAFTGIAASLIDGKTLHVVASIGIKDPNKISPEVRAKLQNFWREARYMIIDEFSMVSKTFMAVMSRNVDIGKQDSPGYKEGEPFGGVNVILCGDLHQFPPVGVGVDEALFGSGAKEGTAEMKLGAEIYKQFKIVVILRKQRRVTDPIWRELLVRLRNGEMREEDVEMLNDLVLKPNQVDVDFEHEPWSKASLVTPRHAVRKLWNEASVRRHCARSGETLYICPAEDRVAERGKRMRPLTLAERYAVAGRMKGKRKRSDKRNDLPGSVELARGMKVLVTSNIQTDLDLANGSRGEIVDIVLHPDEPAGDGGSVVQLKHMPICILVRMERTKASQLNGLEPGVVPVQPVERRMTIKLRRAGKNVERKVRRRQFPITAAYAFTDYRAQGQTLRYVVVDIATLPSFPITLTNVYVALSRSTGRDSIRLLRPFDRTLVQGAVDVDLVLEDERLERLDRETREWWIQMGGLERLQQCREGAR
ncbi:hypothetical protein PsYK624_155710 [Phanerochaete sordida]|uniref:ATP-dependent DNA helicase n=1 Tax=Phanerochaete sordida TaxID=48140 RepID=A0A9P3GPG5_9APHY|nr:hypothetical protein PsYK624_155710 [Phanerochaete sordida]